MYGKKTYLANIRKQFVLQNHYGKRNKECLHCMKIIFQKYVTAKNMQCSTQRSISTLIT